MTTTQNLKVANLTNNELKSIYGRVFSEVFNLFDFKYWNNVIIAGGYAHDLLLNKNASNDVDIFIYNADSQLVKKIYDSIVKLSKGTILKETLATVSIQTQNKAIQLINVQTKKSIDEILSGFDINGCAVYFDGANIGYLDGYESDVLNMQIDCSNIGYHYNTAERIAKYVVTKKWELKNVDMNEFDPLYLFRDTHELELAVQHIKLLNDPLLKQIYEVLHVEKNGKLANLVNGESNYGSKASDALTKIHKGKGLSSEIDFIKNNSVPELNQFGLPMILYKIKTGTYTFDELYESYETDIAGFNSACYLIMYEPDESKVISYFSNVEKFSGKNMNHYNLTYMELSALLNRLELTKFFLLQNKEQFTTLLRIAVHEDNVSLYNMYKLIGSDKRYSYTKSDLLAHKAYNICEELYGLTESEKNKTSITNDTSNKLLQKILKMTDLEFLQYYNEKSDKTSVTELLKSKCLKNIMMSEYQLLNLHGTEKEYYEYEFDNIKKINTETKYTKCTRFLSYIMTSAEHIKFTSEIFEYPLKDSVSKQYALEMLNGTLNENYNFGKQHIDKFLLFLDNVQLIENNKNKKLLLEMLKNNISNLKQNFKKYYSDNYESIYSIATYDELLCNTTTHHNAYDKCELPETYARIENALGYTPEDIIMFKTFNDYTDNTDLNVTRSTSVKNINRSNPIVKFEGTTTMDNVKKLFPNCYTLN